METLTLEKPFRELSAAKIVERSFSLYSTRFLEFFTPFFFAGILNGVIMQAMRSILAPIIPPERLADRFLEWLMAHLGVLVGAASTAAVVIWIISTITNGVAVKYASDLMQRGDASLTTAFNFTIYKLGPLLVAGLISGVLLILGLIFFILPGITVAVMFSLIVPVIIIEDRGAFESLERSRRLVDRSWRKTFMILLLVLFAMVLLSVVGEAISIFFGPLRGIVSGLVSAFIQPIQPLASTYLYYSMRIKETKPAQPVSYKPPIAAEPIPQLPRITEQPRFCIHCGQRLPADAVFCPNCGKRIVKPY